MDLEDIIFGEDVIVVSQRWLLILIICKRWLKWTIILFLWSGTQVAIRGRPAKALGAVMRARVQIPPTPPGYEKYLNNKIFSRVGFG